MIIRTRMTENRKLRLGLFVGAAVFLAACDPVPQGNTNCKSALACEVVTLTAQDIGKEKGKDFGGGVVLRRAQPLGQTLVIDLSLPLSSKAFQEPAGKSILKDFGRNIGIGFCSGSGEHQFFKLGARLRARGFSRDNVLVADQTITSCKGFRS